MKRVVFDTNTVVSALLFTNGRLTWLRHHWQNRRATALISTATTDELIRVLAYPKFRLERREIESLLADYLPYTEPVTVSSRRQSPRCRDPDDQMIIDLALQGGADVVVTGDKALLEMDIGIPIETPSVYRRRPG